MMIYYAQLSLKGPSLYYIITFPSVFSILLKPIQSAFSIDFPVSVTVLFNAVS